MLKPLPRVKNSTWPRVEVPPCSFPHVKHVSILSKPSYHNPMLKEYAIYVPQFPRPPSTTYVICFLEFFNQNPSKPGITPNLSKVLPVPPRYINPCFSQVSFTNSTISSASNQHMYSTICTRYEPTLPPAKSASAFFSALSCSPPANSMIISCSNTLAASISTRNSSPFFLPSQ